MPVYNNELFVNEAVESILNQTLDNYEFIIIDDGSTDTTFEIINSYKDHRIKIIRNDCNQGNYVARNKGMALSIGKYICVMDSDDLSLPDRLFKQYSFMEDNKEFGICGGFVKIMESGEVLKPPTYYNEIKVWLLHNICLIHPSIFIRSKMVKKYELSYNEHYRYAADYDFLVKAAKIFPITCINEEILEYRRHPNQISKKNNMEQGIIADKIRINQLSFFGISATDEEKTLHLKLIKKQMLSNEKDFDKLLGWANYLIFKNFTKMYFEPILLSMFLRKLLKSILKFEIKLISFY